MYEYDVRIEVMNTIEQSMDVLLDKYLKSVEVNWQPSDFLPDSRDVNFFDDVKELQELAHQLDYDLLTVLIGDTITEEALPTYESWLMDVDGVDQVRNNGWSKWVRAWTAEENRHGDLLNKYLYLCGRVNMKELEISTQYLISTGFDIQTARDPYKNFIYTSFQELATNISHRRVASLCKKTGNHQLAKMCGVIAADEARHANAYIDFADRIFQLDPNEMMIALEYMMKKKIVMPAHLMKESGDNTSDLFSHFSDAAQRTSVYTTTDYIEILELLIQKWQIAAISKLDDKGEKARDYVMALPARLTRISERISPSKEKYPFKWLAV